MTATRMTLLSTLTALWLVAAALLWQTDVPEGLHAPSVSATAVFGAATLAETGRYARFLRWDLAAEVAAQLGALMLLVRSRRRLAAHLPGPSPLRAAMLAGAVFAALWLARLPFSLGAHWWSRRHGISHLDYVSFVAGGWSTTLGELVLAAVAGAVVVSLARRLGRRWWIAAWAALVALLAAWALLTPTLLAPRLKPLADRRLAAEIQALARREGLGRTEVQVRKARERTRAVNAEAVGAGPTTTVVLWDTLLEPGVPRGEIRFVAAHELAHVARHHVWKGVAWFALLALPCAWLVARATRLDDPAEIPVAALAAALLALALLPAANAISRRYEREADWIAQRTTADPGAGEGLFRRFAHTNLADPDPPLVWHLLLGTHPTLLKRVELVRAPLTTKNHAAAARPGGSSSRVELSRRAAALRAGPGSP